MLIDDIAMASSSPGGHWTKQMMRDQFIIKPTGIIQSCGDTVQFLGRSISKIARGRSLENKQDYLKYVFIELSMCESTRHVKPPGVTKCSIKNSPGKSETDMAKDLDLKYQKAYRRIVGKLMWLTPIRPGIAFCAKELARHLASPKHYQWIHMEHMVTYLHGTPNESCVRVSKSDMNWTGPLIIRAFCDSDNTGSDISADQRSTSGMVVYMHGFIMITAYKTRAIVATPSGEAEILALYIALHECCAFKNILSELGFGRRIVIHLMSYSTTANRYSSQFGSGKYETY